MDAQVLPGRRACCRRKRLLAWAAQALHWSTQRVAFRPSSVEIHVFSNAPTSVLLRVLSAPPTIRCPSRLIWPLPFVVAGSISFKIERKYEMRGSDNSLPDLPHDDRECLEPLWSSDHRRDCLRSPDAEGTNKD